MLGMKNYPKDYMDACRSRVDADLAAYRKLVAAMKNAATTNKPAVEAFETRFFNDQVLLLDHMFVHRLTGVEGKDGNPLNEVRVLCNSILLNRGKVQIDRLPRWPVSAGSGIKLPPEKSVLKLKAGDQVKLTEADFVRLSEAFLTEIESRYR